DYPATYIVGDKAPRDCGYQWKGFNSKEYVHVVSNFLETEKLACTKSMCTSAAFLALAHKAKTLYQQNKISKEDYKKLTTPGGVAYQILNGSAEPNELVEHFGLG